MVYLLFADGGCRVSIAWNGASSHPGFRPSDVGGDPDAAAPVSGDHEDMFETIMLAIDGSSGLEELFAYAQRLAGHYGSGVLVVCIGATSSVSRSIRQQVTQLRSDGVSARLAVVADGRDTSSVIVRLANAWHADLLLVGPDRGGAGSGIVQRLVEGSACPVLAVPVSGDADQRSASGRSSPVSRA